MQSEAQEQTKTQWLASREALVQRGKNSEAISRYTLIASLTDKECDLAMGFVYSLETQYNRMPVSGPLHQV